MTESYSSRTVFEAMKSRFHQYLEAQYHIWDEGLLASRRDLLNIEGTTFQEPRLEATPYYVSGKPYDHLSIPKPASDVLKIASKTKGAGIPEVPYSHQAEALEKFLGDGRDIIVATGTGSGKTESFLMPIVGALATESLERPTSWELRGMRALLLYPMNALVNDQLSRLRRLLGNEDVAIALKGARAHRATFGRYTSRTPYAGVATKEKDERRLGQFIEEKFLALSDEKRQLLFREGKWPAKDLDRFINVSFTTGPEDSEMLSRREMQERCPDILITNYSMLEYMLLRPIEASIFAQTASWLAADPRNTLTIVLDEAHMYRGSGGAEVAYLLRRLHARLGVPRSRVRYILTSASLGTTPEGTERMKEFAAELSGGKKGDFYLVTGERELKREARPATRQELEALAAFDFGKLHAIGPQPTIAVAEFNRMLGTLGQTTVNGVTSLEELQDGVYRWLLSFGPAGLASNLITASPTRRGEIARSVFPGMEDSQDALESLLALMSFGKVRRTGKVFSPVRAHLFFRGLSAVYACIDPHCSARPSSGSLLGRLYATPRLSCECGARVYELLTHRDCGAAFIRGYLRNEQGTFLWHEPSHGLWDEGGLLEAHLLVDVRRRPIDSAGRLEGTTVWLHKTTGQLSFTEPGGQKTDEYLELLRPDGIVIVQGRQVLSFRAECPVCTRGWKAGTTKIMDLATKGEAPFAQLIRTQVELQPQTIPVTDQSPNGGRKSLVFSDGRQKAARLARDIPREIENDVFRQLIMMAASELKAIGREPACGISLYKAFVHVLAKHSLTLFDGADKELLLKDIRDYRKYHESKLSDALEEDLGHSAPPRYQSLLLRHLGSDFYSLTALTLGYILPVKKAWRQIRGALPEIVEEDRKRIIVPWIQSLASEYAIDPHASVGVRIKAAGHGLGAGPDKHGGIPPRKLSFLRERIQNIERVFDVFVETLCQSAHGIAGYYVLPTKIAIELATEGEDWYQCSRCATVSPVEWWGACPNCLSRTITPVKPGATEYLRARKAFFREPVVAMLNGKLVPFNLSVEEHTAQLGHKDIDEADTTTEEFERRFRDILVNPTDTSIDVLSSTTTMEVGIDIGSLVGVALRNMPPMRQNYQQRAGRAGRRGSSLSTVVTYAQNSPHDSHYFSHPEPMISGEPTLPSVDTNNGKIIERHVWAQLIQSFFQANQNDINHTNIFSVLGETLAFVNGKAPLSLDAFRRWLRTPSAGDCFESIRAWVPRSFNRTVEEVASEFIARLSTNAPKSEAELDPSERDLIEYLFNHGYLPSYAFPRDLCALQIEERAPRNTFPNVKIVQRPQQGLNVALSEYAPGRLVVVDKKTYRVGTIAANGPSTVVDRAERLFDESRVYVYCPECDFTPGFRAVLPEGERCPVCGDADLVGRRVIEPEVVFPEGRREVDEYDDEQVFTNATSAQLSLPEGERPFNWRPLSQQGQIAMARGQQLVIVNKGEEKEGNYPGFNVCRKCGKAVPDGGDTGPHARDYYVAPHDPSKCNGEFSRVYLGYGFSSDVMVLRIPLSNPLRFDPVRRTLRQPIADALQSLAEALAISIARELDIDVREINAGFRFLRDGKQHVADVFAYDTLAGGAGYTVQAERLIENVLDSAEKLLSECNCATSCDKCLRHYGNRFHHAALDRVLALELLKFVRYGEVPARQTSSEEQEILAPLLKMLELEGWSVSQRDAGGITAVRSGRRVTLTSCPSLIRREHYGITDDRNVFAFSPYELSRDLPGAFGVLS